MKAISVQKKWQMAALVVALVALAASAGLFWQFLSHGTVSGRALIPSAQMQHASGLRYIWRVPANLRASPWYRAEVRIWEDGKPLPLRVEDPALVASDGNGRFGVSPFSVGVAQKEFLWFSSSDNTNPAANGRKYEFEMRRTAYRLAIMSVVSLAFSIVAGLMAVPARIWSRLIEIVAKPGDARVLLLRRLAVALAVLAAIVLAQAWPRTRIVARIRLPEAGLIQSENHFFCRLPRWVEQGVAQEFAALYEDGKPMKRSSSWAWQSESGAGSFYCSSGRLARVCFRTADGSDAALNGRAYTLKVPVFPPQLAPRLAVLLGLVSLLLFTYGHELAMTPFSVNRSRFGPWFKSTGWRWAILIVGFAKLWMVAGDEMLAQDYDAHDYAQSATTMVWGGSLPSHPPGFPMIAGIVAQFGVPWRLALEVLYLASCGLLAAGIISLLRSCVIAVLLFAAIAWHPWTLSGFHDFWSYPFVLVLSVALLSIMFRILGQPSNEWTWPIFVGEGCILFFWEWSRTEDPLVYGTFALFVGLALALSRRETHPASWKKRVVLLALPVLMVISLSTGVRLINYFEYGIYAKSRMTSPGLTALMKALYQIKPERDLRYAPVTRSSLQAACDASPTLRQFESTLLDPRNHESRVGESITKVPGEFGPWLIWLLPGSLPWDSREANQVMLAAASEINDALRDGRLSRRHAYYPLDPNWRLWLPGLVPSFVACLRSASSIQRWKSWEGDVTDSPYLEHDFDEAANRRAASAYSPMLLVDGSVPLSRPSIDSVGVEDQRGKLLAASALLTNWLDGGMVFHLRSPSPKESAGFKLLFFQKGTPQFAEQGHTSEWWFTNQYTTVSNTAVLPDTGEKIDYSYRLSVAEFNKKRRMQSWEPRTEILCKVLSWSAAFATLIIVLFGETWDKDRFRRVLACLMLVVGWLVGRATLYGLYDANFAFTVERFMRCVSPLFVLILVLAAAVAAALLKSFFHKTQAGEV